MVISPRDYNDTGGTATDRDVFRYLQVLDEMGDLIPQSRKTSAPEDVRWFLRQGAVKATGSWYLDEAVSLAQRILNKHSGGT